MKILVSNKNGFIKFFLTFSTCFRKNCVSVFLLRLQYCNEINFLTIMMPMSDQALMKLHTP